MFVSSYCLRTEFWASIQVFIIHFIHEPASYFLRHYVVSYILGPNHRPLCVSCPVLWLSNPVYSVPFVSCESSKGHLHVRALTEPSWSHFSRKSYKTYPMDLSNSSSASLHQVSSSQEINLFPAIPTHSRRNHWNESRSAHSEARSARRKIWFQPRK